MIRALAKMVEMRDPYTAGHQHRVAELATAIAREMDLPEGQAEGVHVAGVLHDVGKMCVPVEILTKPGRLTEAEMGLVTTHPKAGHDILDTIEYPWPIARIVLQHHERMDGSGYPSGLSGEEICTEARILGVADVVEAMASHRPYRPAQGMGRALAHVSASRKTLYDPQVADACVMLFSQKAFTFEHTGYADAGIPWLHAGG